MRRALPFSLAVVTVLSILAGTPSLAAVIEPVGADLSINRQGQGFQTVSQTTIVNPGDFVTVSLKGVANIFYPDGCKVTLQPGAVMVIAPLSPCAARSNAQAPGPDNRSFTPEGPPFGREAVIAAAVGVGSFTAYEIYQAHKTNGPAPQPASP